MYSTQTYNAVFEGGAFRLLGHPAIPIPEGQAVRLVVEPVAAPEDILALATRVYEGFSEAELQELEGMILERSHFFQDQRPL